MRFENGWKNIMRFIFEGPPIPQQRPRFFNAKGRIFSYDPQKKEKKKVKEKINEKFEEVYQGIDHIQAAKLSRLLQSKHFCVDFTFIMQVPQSMSNHAKNRLFWGLEPPKKCDLDNLAKFYLDCATGQIWANDNQITYLNMKKKYGDRPMTIMDVFSEERKTIIKDVREIISLFSPYEINEILEKVCNATMIFDQNKIYDLAEKEILEIATILCTLSDLSLKLSKIKKQSHDVIEKINRYKEISMEAI